MSAGEYSFWLEPSGFSFGGPGVNFDNGTSHEMNRASAKRVAAMLEAAYAAGKRARSTELKQLILGEVDQ